MIVSGQDFQESDQQRSSLSTSQIVRNSSAKSHFSINNRNLMIIALIVFIIVGVLIGANLNKLFSHGQSQQLTELQKQEIELKKELQKNKKLAEQIQQNEELMKKQLEESKDIIKQIEQNRSKINAQIAETQKIEASIEQAKIQMQQKLPQENKVINQIDQKQKQMLAQIAQSQKNIEQMNKKYQDLLLQVKVKQQLLNQMAITGIPVAGGNSTLSAISFTGQNSLDTNGQITIPPGNPQYNLWTLPLQRKIQLLQTIIGIDLQSKPYTYPLSDKDEQVQQFMRQYQKTSQVINWHFSELTKEEIKQIKQNIQSANKLKHKLLDQIKADYKQYKNKTGFLDTSKKISYAQYLLALQLNVQLLNLSVRPGSAEDRLFKSQASIMNEKYHFKQEKYPELPICVVVPSYNNQKDGRYMKSIQSLLSQTYKNFKAIIVVDGSQDNTAQLSAKYLKFRKADPQKYILVHKKERKKALQNIYYGVHKYCDFNQILIIFDGDDEIIGQQAFKTLNQIYQKQKLYVLYTQHMAYNTPYSKQKASLGNSEQYPMKIRKQNDYRKYKHAYNHMRSLISDLFLLQRMSTLKYNNGSGFYDILVDNTIFASAFEMSCQKHRYLPQIFYWYNAGTGLNTNKFNKTIAAQIGHQISKKKHYKCIEQILEELQKQQSL